MAFQTTATAAVNPFANQNTSQKGNENWKSDAFVNLLLPYQKADGTETQVKIGVIALKESKTIEGQIIQMFRDDPEGAAERLAKALILDYREASAAANGTTGKLML
jgi:hypothetical protein